jgi:hypothetical protein
MNWPKPWVDLIRPNGSPLGQDALIVATKKCVKQGCEVAETCAVGAEASVPEPTPKRTRTKSKAAPRKRPNLEIPAQPELSAEPPGELPAASEVPVPSVHASSVCLAKPNLGDVHWHKQDSNILDGRESLFLKVWDVVSSFRRPKSETRPVPAKKQAVEDDDLYSNLFK